MLEHCNLIHYPCKTSSAGLVSLLHDEDDDVKSESISALLDLIDDNWHEIANYLPVIQSIANSPNFPNREKSSLLAAKLLYNLELIDEALIQTLNSGDLFSLEDNSLFARTIIATAVRKYCQQRQEKCDSILSTEQQSNLPSNPNDPNSKIYAYCYYLFDSSTKSDIDSKLESLVEKLIDMSLTQDIDQVYQAIGITIESRRLDKLQNILINYSNRFDLLKLCMTRLDKVEISKFFRTMILQLITKVYSDLIPHICDNSRFNEEYVWIVRALYYNNDPEGVAQLLSNLIMVSNDSRKVTSEANANFKSDDVSNENENILLAYQIAFDLLNFENQHFLSSVSNHPALLVTDSESDNVILPCVSESPSKDTDKYCESNSNIPNINDCQNYSNKGNEVVTHTNTTSITVNKGSLNDTKQRLQDILNGKILLKLTVEFLHRANHTDLLPLDQIKASIDPRLSMTQNAVIVCHALMQCGTTCDVFVRENLDWFGKVQCWVKFMASASNGILHKGHVDSSKEVLSSYLPGSGGGSYSEGGSLMALGLIHSNHFDFSIQAYLVEQLYAAESTSPSNYEPIQHGACLGLGLMAFGTCHDVTKSTLQEIIYADCAVSSKGASIGLGLTFFGSGCITLCEELLVQAQDTEHEKITRALSLAIACILYNTEDKADVIISKMKKDKNPMIRYGAMFSIGLAYCGTSNQKALRQLLHYEVVDVCDDVKKAAIIAISFVMCRDPEQLTDIIGLLAESFNPHVRYAVAMSLGCGCSGTGLQSAINVLVPLTQDTVDYVRSGALLGLGLVLVQCNELKVYQDQVSKIRDLVLKVSTDNDEDSIARFGAIISQGILDAGGQNCTISFFTSNNILRPESVAGFLFFCQLWFWYPLILMISMAFRPTGLIAINSNLELDSNFKIGCTLPSRKLSYVKSTVRSKKDNQKELVTATLTSISRRRQYKKIKQMNVALKKHSESVCESDTRTDIDMKEKTVNDTVKNQENIDTNDISKITIEQPTIEKQYTILTNPCRVLDTQENSIILDLPSNESVPIDSRKKSGIVILTKRSVE